MSGNREPRGSADANVTLVQALDVTEPLRLLLDHTDTPIGRLAIVADEDGRLRAVGWTDEQTDGRMAQQLFACSGERRHSIVPARNPGGFTERLRAYFAG